MNIELINRLRGNKLEENEITDFVSTGSLALNKIISGEYHKGIGIGTITQFVGKSSTGKTLFATSILGEAQKKGYYTKIIDSENTLNPNFARTLGLDPDKLLYSNPDTFEDAFEDIKNTIQEIRKEDKKTPIVIAIDSVAVLTSKNEIDEEKKKEKKEGYFEQSMTEGAQRAKTFGNCLRRITPIIKDNKVALILINQLRSKIGVIYGNPEVAAAGGMSLEYFLSVNLHITSNKSSDVLRDKEENPIGIEGEIECKKNKIAVPFQKCLFKVEFNKGLNKYFGLFEEFLKDGTIISPSQGWYQLGGSKFRSKDFDTLLLDKTNKDFEPIRQKLNIG